ncbi:hypothetical protein ES676_06130 [Bizionia saleffrena]|uniref:Uncharacterized protein n=1 Tax=Bizionia saleffrena TaxID=291189 RepID=A0A8H2LHE7_9FLAO|nr:hypothetical protein [Bizionia saleffrena]TYB76027.1 hypothetical protein ES676_06130 [Bizionia saleffrena]
MRHLETNTGIMLRKKKTALLILTSILLLSCGTQKKSYPDYVHGLSLNKNKKKVSKDSLFIVTPSIEIYHYVNRKSSAKYDKREIIKKFILETLKSELNKTDYYDLSLMSKDYRSVNNVLEGIISEKYKNPDWIVSAPNDILIDEKKYTVLIRTIGVYGDSNKVIMYFSIINNESKTIESVDRYEYDESPLETQKTKNRIKKAFSKITNT